jgi:hypothetical protein
MSRLVVRSAVRTLHAARLARGLPLGRDDPPRLAQVALERVIRDLIEQDADPPAGTDIPRVKIDVGRFFDHQRLQAVDAIVQRRHFIVHEGDLVRHERGGQTRVHPITRKYVDDSLAFLDTLVGHLEGLE